MATIIKIKRSSGTSTPNLGQGELGYSWGSSAYSDNQGATVTSYGKLFLGTGTETGGVAANIEVIGGKYFTDLLDHSHGNLTSNSAAIVDSSGKIDQWNVDNLTLDGNTLSSSNTDGDIVLDPNGSGEIVVPDDTYLTFGTSKDAKIKYDETTDDRVEVSGADWNFSSGVAISLSDTTAATSSSSGALIVSGGVGIGGDLYIGGSINVGSQATPANFTVAGDLTVQGGDLNFVDSATNINLKDNTPSALSIKEGSNSYIKIDTTDGSELITIGTSNVDIDNNLNVDGGSITTNQTTFNLLNTTASVVNFAGDAATINVGTSSTIVDFGALRVQGTTIFGEPGTQTITLDPYPAGGDSGGDVVVRGNFKVTGTTTTVNSTVMTVNDPVFTLGDSISEKTVTSAATTGSTTLTLDNTTGLNAGDIVSGTNIVVGTVIVSIDSSTAITIDNAITGGIAAGADLIFTQGADDNLDRGIEFKYYNSGLKTGFFGYDESGISEDVVNYYFTYIPDATNTNNVFSGTVGSAYFKTVKLDDGVLNGVAFFDQYKRLTRTVAAGTSDATTSNQILTVNGSGVPVWSTTLDGGTY